MKNDKERKEKSAELIKLQIQINSRFYREGKISGFELLKQMDRICNWIDLHEKDLDKQIN